MPTCNGPGCGVVWKCDMQHGVVDGRCTECLLMAQAASNLNLDQIAAIARRVERAVAKDSYRLEYREGFRWDPGTVVIDDSGGNRPAYRVKASCSNCAWAGEVRRPRGSEPRRFYSCPECGCRTVRSLGKFAGGDAADSVLASCPCGEPSPIGAKPCTPEQPCSYGQGKAKERWL